MIKQFFLALLLSAFLVSFVKAEIYFPRAEPVSENVYAIIGPTDQRSEDNDGLNNNIGFIITSDGVILIDSGASYFGAEKINQAVSKITSMPVRWVINTGSQDHRWLGNDYFAKQGAKIIAMERTAKTQEQFAQQHMEKLEKFLGSRLEGTVPLPAVERYADDAYSLTLGGVTLELIYTDAHFPGDIMIWLPRKKVLFSGDLVYVDRVFSVHPWSSVRNAQQAFRQVIQLNPQHIIPGHGRVANLSKAKADCGDYYDFLNDTVGAAAIEMEDMEEVIKRYSVMPRFEHLHHFDELHRINMNRTYLEYESM